MDCTEQNLRMPENATQISTEEAVRLHRLKSFHTLRLGRIESWGAHGPEPLDGTDWVIVGYGGRGYLVIDRRSSESFSKEIQSLSDYQREHAGAEKAADLVFEEGPECSSPRPE